MISSSNRRHILFIFLTILSQTITLAQQQQQQNQNQQQHHHHLRQYHRQQQQEQCKREEYPARTYSGRSDDECSMISFSCSISTTTNEETTTTTEEEEGITTEESAIITNTINNNNIEQVYFNDQDDCGCGCTNCTMLYTEFDEVRSYTTRFDSPTYENCEEAIFCVEEIGEMFFKDECGCGCAIITDTQEEEDDEEEEVSTNNNNTTTNCPIEAEGKRYVFNLLGGCTDPEVAVNCNEDVQEVYFNDECGCGCIKPNTTTTTTMSSSPTASPVDDASMSPLCPKEDPSLRYVYETLDECRQNRVICDEEEEDEETYFDDECGCGCKKVGSDEEEEEEEEEVDNTNNSTTISNATTTPVKECLRGINPARNYTGFNDEECTTLRFTCGTDEIYFNDNDDCGCGCETLMIDPPSNSTTTATPTTTTETCPRDDPARTYKAFNDTACDEALFTCGENEVYFNENDDCGCGCTNCAVHNNSETKTYMYSINDLEYFSCEEKVTCNVTQGDAFFVDECGCGCEKADTPDGDCPIEEEDKRYVFQIPGGCVVEVAVNCENDEVYFDDKCGCGCIKSDNVTAVPTTSPILSSTCPKDDPSLQYVYETLDECRQNRVICDDSTEKYFDDECGCGCRSLDKEVNSNNNTETNSTTKGEECIRDDPARSYQGLDDAECSAIRFICEPDEIYFNDNDDCGCGCESLVVTTSVNNTTTKNGECLRDDPNKIYKGFNDTACFGMYIICEDEQLYFSDDDGCGCGCAVVTTTTNSTKKNSTDKCSRDDPARTYKGKSDEQCSLVRFNCEEGETYFNDNDDCGCGCEVVGGMNATTNSTDDGTKKTNKCSRDDPTRTYKGKSDGQCSTMRFACGEGETYFNDKCGCGCEMEGGMNTTTNSTDDGTKKTNKCSRDDPTRTYKGKSDGQCSTMRFTCGEGETYFNDKCGCGCEMVGGMNTTNNSTDDGTKKNSTNKCSRDDPTRTYKGKSDGQCSTMRFACGEGETYFNDKCGCGCEMVGGMNATTNSTDNGTNKNSTKKCSRDDPARTYKGKSDEQCSLVRFNCEEGEIYFNDNDDCGCGCEMLGGMNTTTNSTGDDDASKKNSTKKCSRDDPARTYKGKSDNQCSSVRFNCEEGEIYFNDNDDCGCGCEKLSTNNNNSTTIIATSTKKNTTTTTTECNITESEGRYIYTTKKECTENEWTCEKSNEIKFKDHCGCGCKSVTPEMGETLGGGGGEKCESDDKSKRYVTDVECPQVPLSCKGDDEKFFEDECGCGCQIVSSEVTSDAAVASQNVTSHGDRLCTQPIWMGAFSMVLLATGFAFNV